MGCLILSTQVFQPVANFGKESHEDFKTSMENSWVIVSFYSQICRLRLKLMLPLKYHGRILAK